MKMILKVFMIPVFLILAIISLMGKLLSNLSGYVFAALLFVIAGCAIFCIVKANWLSLAILAGMAVAAFLFLFFIVWVSFTADKWKNQLREFIRS